MLTSEERDRAMGLERTPPTRMTSFRRKPTTQRETDMSTATTTRGTVVHTTARPTHAHPSYTPGCDACTLNSSWLWVVVNHPTQDQYDAAEVAYLSGDQPALDTIREQIEEARS